VNVAVTAVSGKSGGGGSMEFALLSLLGGLGVFGHLRGRARVRQLPHAVLLPLGLPGPAAR
jgi:hypothetical protein